VNASALNVRERASADSRIVAQAKRGVALTVVSRNDGWVQVRLGDRRVGWVAERFVSTDLVPEQRSGGRAARATSKPTAGKRGCESEYSFIETPTLSRGSEADAHGLVVVEATVSAKGIVTATKVISNTTGDPSAGAAAEREIRSARFAPPVRNCEPRAFIFTYRRTF
jgi:uncharacterized protein YgiM (DUF1202 family)